MKSKASTPRIAAQQLLARHLKKGYSLIALHPYVDLSGATSHWRTRLKHPTTGEKIIRPLSIRDGRWLLAEPPCPPSGKLLYGLDTLGAAKIDASVFILEGEQKVEAFNALGIAAVTSGGATSAKGFDWTPLSGRTCVIWPDNDKPGEKYAQEVSEILGKLNCEVRQIDVAQLGLSTSEDCIDWLARQPLATASSVLALATVERATQSTDAEIVRDAVSRLFFDAGALFVPEVLHSLQGLRLADRAEFARIRQIAKQSKVSMKDFDELSNQHTGEVEIKGFQFEDVTPASMPVDGTQLLDVLCATIRRYVVADEATIGLAGLWIMHTWSMPAWMVSPIANITAPTKRCGKTILLTVMSELCYRPVMSSNISTAAIFRFVDQYSPTLLIDEVDSWLRTVEDARGILNCGYTKKSAVVIRCDGDDNTPKAFSVWGAKALCGIGQIAATLQDRSIPLRLRRKGTGEVTENINHASDELFVELRSQFARWSADHLESLKLRRPIPVTGLHDRANDSLEPLLAIADEVGGRWSKLARKYAREAFEPSEGGLGVEEELLSDIKECFSAKERLGTNELLAALNNNPEAQWADWNRRNGITSRQLARILAGFGIKPKPMRLESRSPRERTLRAYALQDFREAFDRYLGPGEGVTRVTTLQRRPAKGLRRSKCVTAAPTVTGQNSRKPSKKAVRNGVTVGGGRGANNYCAAQARHSARRATVLGPRLAGSRTSPKNGPARPVWELRSRPNKRRSKSRQNTAATFAATV